MNRADKADLRTRFREALNAMEEKDIRQIVDGIKDMNKARYALCPDCRRKVQVEFPDFKGQAQALQILMAEGFGKPREQQDVNVSVTLKAIKEMSNEELAALVEGHELTRGE